MFCECHDVIVRHGRTTVLDVDGLVIPAGRITAVVGANGAGKTTLLEVAGLLRRPTRGRVSLWGKPADAGNEALRRRVVMVMHPGYMFRGTVWSNVLYGLKARGIAPADARQRAADALELVELADFARRDPASLSAGERQRVNLARAIAIGPEAILLDEPVANVDSVTVAIIGQLLCGYRDRHGTTIVYTSPGDGQLRPIADRTVTLSAGRVTDQQGALADAPTQ